MATNNSVTPNITERDWDFDAFYLDEFAGAGHVNSNTQCRLSRFDGTDANNNIILGTETAKLDLLNPLEDATLVTTVEKTGPNNGGKTHPYWCYVPINVQRTGTGPFKVCLFFGPPGPVMNRQGLRAFFEGHDVALIAIEGIEDSPKFGIGITPGQIDQLLAAVMGPAAPGAGDWTIISMAGYSTGFRGMNRTINDLLTDAQLTGVKKMIYFDCLYQHTRPAPGNNSFRAMTKVNTNSPAANFVVYELSGNSTDDEKQIVGGTPRHTNGSFWTQFPPNADPNSSSNTLTELANLKTNGLPALEALALARLVDAGLEDGFFDRTTITAFTDGQLLLDAIDNQLRPRGSYASTPARATSTGKVFVGDWLTPATDIAKLVKLAGAMEVPVIDKFKLLGWAPTGSLADVAHDSHVPEFGWEHLLG